MESLTKYDMDVILDDRVRSGNRAPLRGGIYRFGAKGRGETNRECDKSHSRKAG